MTKPIGTLVALINDFQDMLHEAECRGDVAMILNCKSEIDHLEMVIQSEDFCDETQNP
jgi:hypothetical protein